jgi:hypothetical protein
MGATYYTQVLRLVVELLIGVHSLPLAPFVGAVVVGSVGGKFERGRPDARAWQSAGAGPGLLYTRFKYSRQVSFSPFWLGASFAALIGTLRGYLRGGFLGVRCRAHSGQPSDRNSTAPGSPLTEALRPSGRKKSRSTVNCHGYDRIEETAHQLIETVSHSHQDSWRKIADNKQPPC